MAKTTKYDRIEVNKNAGHRRQKTMGFDVNNFDHSVHAVGGGQTSPGHRRRKTVDLDSALNQSCYVRNNNALSKITE